MATLNPATWHGLRNFGAIAPGFQADILLLPDLESFEPDLVLKRGAPVAEFPRAEVPEWVKHTVRVQPTASNDFQIPWQSGPARVIALVEGQIVTDEAQEEPRVEDGLAVADPERDLAKIAVVERHLGTGRIGLGFVRGFGLRRGAMATTIAHDAHNIVVVGVDDGDMARAVQRLAEMGGGLVVIADRGVQAELPLPVAGIVSDAPYEEVVEASEACLAAARELGCEFPAPFQTLSFLALSVIPKLKITDRGLIDVDEFAVVSLEAP
jgi:adenine deaminase